MSDWSDKESAYDEGFDHGVISILVIELCLVIVLKLLEAFLGVL